MPRRKLGIDYDTAWARRYPVRLARAIVLDDFSKPVLRVALSPRVFGLEHLDPVEGPMILAANHASHLDTALLLVDTAVLAAASDDRRRRGRLFLRPPLEGSRVVVRPRRHPDGAVEGESALG